MDTNTTSMTANNTAPVTDAADKAENKESTRDVAGLQAEIDRLKNAVSRANSEAAEWKKKHNALLSEDEQKKQAEAEEKATLQARVAELEKQTTVSNYTAKYIALGYDAELAASTAKAMADGDMETVFRNGETHKAVLEKKIKEDLMNKTPKPDGAGGGKQPEDSDIAKAKELAKAKFGNSKSYDEIMSKYK